MRTPINPPPRSKIISIIKDDKDKQFLVKQSLKGKWTFFTVAFKSQKLERQMNKLNTIAEQIALRNKLIDSTSVDNYMISNSSINTSSCNGRIEKCHTNIPRQKKHVEKS